LVCPPPVHPDRQRSRMTTADGRSPGSRVATFRRLPGTRESQWHVDGRLAAYSCGGSRSIKQLLARTAFPFDPNLGTVSDRLGMKFRARQIDLSFMDRRPAWCSFRPSAFDLRKRIPSNAGVMFAKCQNANTSSCFDAYSGRPAYPSTAVVPTRLFRAAPAARAGQRSWASMPIAIATMNKTIGGESAARFASAGPGHSPTRPQPTPNRSAPNSSG
jgi:hypothetical protein